MSGWDGNTIKLGTCELEVVEVRTEFRGMPMKTQKGDPKIVVKFIDTDGGELSVNYMLKGSMVFRLLQVVNALGTTKEELEADGVEPEHFSMKQVACKYLMNGCSFKAEVSKNGDFMEMKPLKQDAPEPGSAIGTTPPDDSKIPF